MCLLLLERHGGYTAPIILTPNAIFVSDKIKVDIRGSVKDAVKDTAMEISVFMFLLVIVGCMVAPAFAPFVTV